MDLEKPIMRPLALVTGASSGLGFELARQFAMNGFDLVIAARDSDLNKKRDVLMDLGADVYPVQSDLSTWSGVETLYSTIKKMDRPLEAAVICAVSGSGGRFWETELRRELELIRMNVLASIHLTKRILSGMIEEGSGRILFTSSIGEVSKPAPYEAVFASSKAFLSSFAESLRIELKDSGVTVTSLTHGSENPEAIAHQGFVALMKGKDQVQPGILKKIIPKWAKAYVHRNLSAQSSAEENAS
jgi:short-subunit dehydrogenase